jgi:hypothetical protein
MGWTGNPGSDVDLSVIFNGETLSKSNPFTSGGGMHLGNEIADVSGVGQESAVYTPSFQAGSYTVKVDLISGSTATVNTFVIQNPLTTGTVIGTFNNTLTPTSPSASNTITVTVPTQANANPDAAARRPRSSRNARETPRPLRSSSARALKADIKRSSWPPAPAREQRAQRERTHPRR